MNWMGDLILATDDASIDEFRAQGDAALSADGWQDQAAFRNSCYPAKQEDCSLHRAQEEARSSEKEIPCMTWLSVNF